MFLRQLKIRDFRNYSSFNLDCNKLKTIILGQNAQGKSNILEAINILATSESARATKDSDLIKWEHDFALIFALIENKEGEIEIALQINKNGRRKLKINNVSKKATQADLIGNFFTVMFSCDDLLLIKGTPSLRRHWLDSILFQLDKKYHKLHKDCLKSVTQKNSLLKAAKEKGMSRKHLSDQIEIWNEQIINHGAEIILGRIKFITEIIPVASVFLKNISRNHEHLDLMYKSSIILSDEIIKNNILNNLTTIKKSFKDAMENAFEEEITRGQSVIGPHRDDLIFLVNGKEAKSFASQGQQRSIVLALKLAELKIIEERKGEIPVLLLDDVFAELDESRQDYLLHNLPENIQTFITTTHISNIQKELLENARLIKIENGKGEKSEI